MPGQSVERLSRVKQPQEGALAPRFGPNHQHIKAARRPNPVPQFYASPTSIYCVHKLASSYLHSFQRLVLVGNRSKFTLKSILTFKHFPLEMRRNGQEVDLPWSTWNMLAFALFFQERSLATSLKAYLLYFSLSSQICFHELASLSKAMQFPGGPARIPYLNPWSRSNMLIARKGKVFSFAYLVLKILVGFWKWPV